VAKAAKQPGKRGRQSRRTGFAGLVSAERRRIDKALQTATSRRADIDREIEALQRELSAMDAFFSAKQGGGGALATGRRGRRGEKRQRLLDLIKTAPEGLTRGEIIDKLNAAEKSAQQSISNALSALFKSKALKREGRRYRIA
jgi:hypothetical protein